MRSTARTHLTLAALAYLAFAVYGSLVPLDFRPRPLAQAWAAFREVPFLELGIASRADWVANLLLFIPLAFLWTGALTLGRSLPWRVAASLFILGAGIALSVGIEFTQLFFPPRTVSQNDILAEALGALIGVAAWWSAGGRLVRWYEGWREPGTPSGLAQRLLWAYLAVVFAYGVLPLDLTLSVVEIFHKWREGKLNLIPFAALPPDPAHALYDLASDALLWLPPAMLWRLGGRCGTGGAVGRAFGAAVLLEFLQLFVYSRVSDLTDLFTAALGAAAGGGLGAHLAGAGRERLGVHTAWAHPSPRWLPLGLALAWIGGLMALFWYPFDFRTDRAFVSERLGSFGNVPFMAYYYGTEFRAVTEVLHKLVFFAPLGALLAWFVSGLPWLWRGWATAASMLVIAGTALGIELGQVLLPDKNPDSTDGFLEGLGGLAGFLLFRAVRVRLTSRTRPRRPMRAS